MTTTTPLSPLETMAVELDLIASDYSFTLSDGARGTLRTTADVLGWLHRQADFRSSRSTPQSLTSTVAAAERLAAVLPGDDFEEDDVSTVVHGILGLANASASVVALVAHEWSGDSAPGVHFTCSEAEVLADLVRAAGDDPDAFLAAHASGDDEADDMHHDLFLAQQAR